MHGFRLFLQGRGCSREWVIVFTVVASLGVLSNWWLIGTAVTSDMQHSDEAHLGLSFAAIATSAMAAWLLEPAVPWRERVSSRTLEGPRIGLCVVALVLLAWPSSAVSGESLQHIALGWGLFGLSMMVAVVNARWAAMPQAVTLLASLVPTLVPVEWNSLTPTQRGPAFIVVALTLVLVGMPVWLLARGGGRDRR